MSNGYIKSLDGVRAIAIILVMTFHAGITHFGWIGVQLFFVLSGFLITGILWKERSAPTTVLFKLKKFWVRRSLRIFPLYLAYLLVLGLLYLALHVPPNYHEWFPYLVTYTFNFTRSLPGWSGDPLFTHLWSLCIEEQFYLFFPLMIFFFPTRLTRPLMVSVVFLAPLIRLMLGSYYKERGLAPEIVADSIYWNTLSHLDAFFMGGIIHVLSLTDRVKRPLRLFTGALALVLLAGLWNFLHSDSGAFYFNDLGYNHGLIGNYEYLWHYTLLNILFASLILAIVSPRSQASFNRFRTLLENKWMVSIGKVSYGMYVFHWGILFYLNKYLFSSDSIPVKCLLFIPYTLVIYLVASLSYRVFESRFIKLKDYFFSDRAYVKKDISLMETNTAIDEKLS